MNAIRRTLRAGFSLMEIVITIAIIAIMLGVAIPNLMGFMERSRVSSTKSDLHTYKQAIDMFYADTSNYPTDLQDLIEKPSDERIAAKWANPYVDKLKEDGWGHEYQYERTAQGAHPYELYSFGPKGEDAPEEERISAWE